MSEWIKKLTERYNEVNESQKAALAKQLSKASAGSEKGKKAVTLPKAPFKIPEEIAATERTAFHGAAAGAHKAGKSHFSFQGKKYPVTMQKDTATAIADQKEGTDEGYSSMVSKATRDRIKKSVAQNKPPVVNPKYKATQSADRNKDTNEMSSKEKMKRGLYNGSKDDGVTINPKEKKEKNASAEMTAEGTQWTVYSRILENRAAHYKGATDAMPADDGVSPNAKAMKKKMDDTKDVRNDDEKGHDDVSKAGRVGPSPKHRSGDNKAGDKSVINKPEDVTKKGEG